MSKQAAEFEQLIDKHLKIALREIGPIKPWFDPEVDCWIFEHELYPVSYGGDSKEEVIWGFPLYVRQFIEERLKGNIAVFVEEQTKGHGGKRPGAGRPNGTTKAPTAVIRLPLEIVQWIKSDPTHLEQVRNLLHYR